MKDNIVCLLLDHGANINLKNLYNCSGLMYLVKSKSTLLTNKILSTQFDVENSYNGNENLILAIMTKQEDMAIELIKRGASVNIAYTCHAYRHSPLICAIKKNMANVVTLLLKNNADIYTKSYNNEQLYILFKHKQIELATKLISIDNGIDYFKCKKQFDKRKRSKKVDVNHSADSKFSMLYYAVKYNYEDSAIVLLHKNIANNNDFNYTTRLAITKGMKRLIEHFMIKHKENLYFVNQQGDTILHQAIFLKKYDIVQILLNYGYDRCIKNNGGLDANDLMLKYNVLTVVQVPTPTTLTPNIDSNSRVLLHNIMKRDGLKLYNVANLYNINDTTFNYMRDTFMQIQQLIMQNDPTVYEHIFTLANKTCIDVKCSGDNIINTLVKKINYKYCIDNNVDICGLIYYGVTHYDYDKANIYGVTPLHRSIINDLTDVALMLIDNGFDVNYVNKKGQTPLYLAISCKNETIAKKILSLGNVNIHHKDQANCTILMRAMKNAMNDVVDMLIARGADYMARSDDDSQLEIMIEGGYECIAINYINNSGPIVGTGLLKTAIVNGMEKLAILFD